VTAKTDPRVTKRKVTMTSAIVTREGDKIVTRTIEASDYVRPDFLEAYVTDARTRWQHVEVSDEPDAGPAGYDGATADHLGRTYYPASNCKNCTHAPQGYTVVKES
jgi:hypothetical protein